VNELGQLAYRCKKCQSIEIYFTITETRTCNQQQGHFENLLVHDFDQVPMDEKMEEIGCYGCKSHWRGDSSDKPWTELFDWSNSFANEHWNEDEDE